MLRLSNTLKHGLYIFLSIIGFFALMKLFNLEHIHELRMMNFVFVIYFINRLIRENYIDDSKIGYVDNLKSAFLASALAVVLSCAGLSFYLILINPEFVSVLENGFIWGNDLTVSRVLLSLFMEGMASSAVVAFTLMQYWKNHKRETRSVILD